jgi:Flp pilus assembly protein TadG
MRNRIQHLRRDERGMSMVFVSVSFMALLSATTLAIDVGMFMTARSQAQNAADAGAHAGAVALVFNSYTNRTPTGPVVKSAMNAALANNVMGSPVAIEDTDVTFPLDPNGQANRVQVVVYRTAARNNAVNTLMGTFFGVNKVDITATATGEAAPANAMTCVKPFMIPDKWREVQSPPWDTGDTFDKYTKQGAPLPNPDVYSGQDTGASYTGYKNTLESEGGDRGKELVLRAGTGDNINPSFYFSWKMPGDTGGDFYRENIANCNQSLMHSGEKIIQEPGDKSGPTIQGIQALIDKDPNAVWSTSCSCVTGSKFGTSPRVFPIPMYNPDYYAEGKKNGRVADFEIANFLGFFADHVQGNAIYGRITQITGIVDRNASNAPINSFPTAIRLVQ